SPPHRSSYPCCCPRFLSCPCPLSSPCPLPRGEGDPYSYTYGVSDDYSKAAFNAAETADANGSNGSYSVALPDGRTQHVKYTADHYNGYVADVSYEGVTVYPEVKAYAPAAPYAPAPYHA
ncbi:cuticle protein 8, partial [Eurytemora carolleeae]|uniref:cuticle protein 8 n=1 Tax=Eurytemora carolleeae TaxID=1294199 RepID=UPI000C7780A9